MHIFIDESGTFANPDGRAVAPSVVFALVLRTRRVAAAGLRFREMKVRWGLGAQEVTGGMLNEAHVSETIRMLKEFDALGFVQVVDLGLESDAAITRHREGQAEGITENLTREHQPDLIQSLENMKALLLRMPNQLYVQSCLVIQLIWEVTQWSTLRYVRKYPAELGSFTWLVDPKDRVRTEYEQYWTKTILPYLQAKSFKTPFLTLEGADYSHFDKFQETMDSLPGHLRPAKPDHRGPLATVRASGILRDISFPDSRDETGLQIVHVLANGTRRALIGNLQEAGWGGLGLLLVSRPGGAVRIARFDPEARPGPQEVPYKKQTAIWNATATLHWAAPPPTVPSTPRTDQGGRNRWLSMSEDIDE